MPGQKQRLVVMFWVPKQPLGSHLTTSNSKKISWGSISPDSPQLLRTRQRTNSGTTTGKLDQCNLVPSALCHYIADVLKQTAPLLSPCAPCPCLSPPPSFSFTFFHFLLFTNLLPCLTYFPLFIQSLASSIIHSSLTLLSFHLCMQAPYNTDIVKLIPYIGNEIHKSKECKLQVLVVCTVFCQP